MSKPSRPGRRQGPSNGMAVDALGAIAYDPSENVKDLMDASVQALMERQNLLADICDEKIKRLESEVGNADKMAILRASHNTEIRHMESDRVDKIRSVDVANAAATAAQLLSAVTTLASTAQATAETLRNQVAATAAAVASQTERIINPIVERVAVLEKSSYRGEGRSTLADPAMDALVTEMKKISGGADRRSGNTEGSGDVIKWIALGISMIVGLIAIGTFVFITTRQ